MDRAVIPLQKDYSDAVGFSRRPWEPGKIGDQHRLSRNDRLWRDHVELTD